MTREEQISEKAKYYVDCVNKEYNVPESIQRLLKSTYIAGAKFADEHPINVWHNNEEEPSITTIPLAKVWGKIHLW